ncbi:MAG: MlaA family lipoprotein [Opitutales bacterium]
MNRARRNPCIHRWCSYWICVLLVVPLLHLGCASQPGTTSTTDPLEPLNRELYALNEWVDILVLRPATGLYRTLIPRFIRQRITNFSRNLQEPIISLNQLLQGKGMEAWNDFTRFFVNSTFGIGGLFDVASKLDYPEHEEDFGQTFAVWGVPSGPYIFLPIFGPATLRQVPDRAADGTSRNLIINALTDFFTATNIIFLVNERNEAERGLQRVREAVDPYLFLRESYLQRREFLIHDGNLPDEAFDDLSIDIPMDEAPLPEATEETPEPAPDDASSTAPDAAPFEGGGGASFPAEPTTRSSALAEEFLEVSAGDKPWPLGRTIPLR